jgi:hypothetical protein
MQGGGEQAANAGLRTVLNQSIAEQYLIQAHEDDVTTLVFFNDEVLNDDFSDWTVEGNDSGALSQLLTRAERVSSRGVQTSLIRQNWRTATSPKIELTNAYHPSS